MSTVVLVVVLVGLALGVPVAFAYGERLDLEAPISESHRSEAP